MADNQDDGDKPNFYELLCLDPRATKEDVKKAYRKQALLFHPDKMKPHMKEEASQHFQLISEAYEVLSDDTKRELYDRYGYEGVKAGGDPNPQPAAGFDVFHRGPPQGFGFDTPFFASFGVPAHAQFHDHHQQHMRNFESMFGGFGGFGAFPAPPPSLFSDNFAQFQGQHQQFHQQHHPQHQGSFFGDDFQQQSRPTLFSTSPFANQSSSSSSQTQWAGTGTSSSPFTDVGGRGGFTSTSSSSSSSFGGGTRTSTRTTIVNGKRTTVTEVTDAQGVTTTTRENPDGTRETFVNGVPTAIEAGSTEGTRTLEGNMQQPISIPDDGDAYYDRQYGSSGAGGRLGGRGGHRNVPYSNPSSSSSSPRSAASKTTYSRTHPRSNNSNQGRRSTAVPETIVLDGDDDEDMYEDLSRQYPRRNSVHQQQPLRERHNHHMDEDPNLYTGKDMSNEKEAGNDTRIEDFGDD
ncbi:DnaJ sub B member 4 [Mortierella claussenii]|nr:DnaJ sub B member 4 [Mortierella claussenii]